MRPLVLALLLTVRADARAPGEMEFGTGFISPSSKAIPARAVGRVQQVPLAGRGRAGAKAFVHQWPGVYFETAFEAQELLLEFNDPLNEYRLLIDERPPVAIVRPGKAEARIVGLGRGVHHVRLEKVTESGSSRGSFLGFYGSSTAQPRSVQSRDRRIEFIGDSAMAGYGSRSPKRICTAEEVRRTTDTQQAFPALLAKDLNADYQVNALSGSGLIRNADGNAPDRTIRQLYPFTFFDKSVAYSDAGWKPQIIVVKLQADLVGALKPTEKWQNSVELARDYAVAYGRFLGRLHRRHGAASYLVWWFDPSSITDPPTASLVGAMQAEIAKSAAGAGIRQLHFLPVNGMTLERTACAYHYSLSDHRQIARYFLKFIEARPELWAGGR